MTALVARNVILFHGIAISFPDITYLKASVSECQCKLPFVQNAIWCIYLIVVRYLSKPVVWIFIVNYV